MIVTDGGKLSSNCLKPSLNLLQSLRQTFRTTARGRHLLQCTLQNSNHLPGLPVANHIAVRRATAADAKTIAAICSKVWDVDFRDTIMHITDASCAAFYLLCNALLQLSSLYSLKCRLSRSALCRRPDRRQALQPSLVASSPMQWKQMSKDRLHQLWKARSR